MKLFLSIFRDAFANIRSKRSLWIIFSAFIRILILIALNRLLTKQLDFQNLSSYYIVLSIYNFFGSIIIGPFGEYIIKIFFKTNSNYNIAFFLESFYKKLFLPIAFMSLILLVIGLYFYFGLTNNYFIEIPVLISLMLIFRGTFDTNIYFINALGYYRWYSILITFNALVYYGLAFLFTKIFQPTYFIWIGGFVLSNIIFSTITIYVLRSYAINKSSKRKFYFNSKLKKFVPSLIIINILLWFLTDGFRFLSEFKFGLESSAILLLGFALASQLFSIMANFILPIFTPNLVKGYSEKSKITRYISFKNYFLKVAPFLILTLILSLLFSKTLISVLVDESKIKEELIIVFIIGLLVEFLRSLIAVIKNYKISENKLIYQIYSLIIPSILLVLIPFIPMNSIIIFALYMFFIYFIYFITSILFSLRLKNSID